MLVTLLVSQPVRSSLKLARSRRSESKSVTAVTSHSPTGPYVFAPAVASEFQYVSAAFSSA